MLRTLANQSRRLLSTRMFSVSAVTQVDQQTFDAATKLVSTLSEEPGNDVKLQLYALFKQSTDGKCNKPRPGPMDFIGRAKWDAWNSLGAISKDDAREKYVTLVYKLAGKAPPSSGQAQSQADVKETKQAASEQVTPSNSGDEVLANLDDRGVFHITFNRPTKFNAITMKMYTAFAEHLERAALDDRINFTVIRGAGSYFTSGNDLANFASAGKSGNLEEALAFRFPIIRRFLYAFIEHPKVLMAVVNGPAIGVGATLLAHCDFVYAAKSATIHTPFLKLGLAPEAGSSYTFPRAMGPMLANRMLLLGEKIPASQFVNTGFISECVDDAQLDSVVNKRIAELLSFPKYSLRVSKQLMRQHELNEIRRSTELEFQAIADGVKRPEVIANAVKAYMELMSKKK